ncbi:transcriptional regulator [Corynebacterium uropygiale]|uniref:Transcriptional regulator n=1 Tax=Corynebacterium uropygiale TaxID=1775911 RepID=A0A9X1QS12_9CORY|nr:transcriptional regulator [Corynebacterium uropygiale]
MPEIDGLFTQAKRLDQIPEIVRDAAHLLEGTPGDELDVQVRVDEGQFPNVDEAVARRKEAERMRAEATRLARECAVDLSAQGMSFRDIGQLLGVSYQYAQKLARS